MSLHATLASLKAGPALRSLLLLLRRDHACEMVRTGCVVHILPRSRGARIRLRRGSRF
jgi:hypothetical protein